MPHDPMTTLALQPISLMNGWAPILIQAIAAVSLVFAVGWRTRRWRLIWLPVSLAVGVIASVLTYAYLEWADLSGGRSAPIVFWVWVILSGLAVGVLVLGWRGSGWWRRAVAVLTVPLCLLGVALGVNVWTGYVPTVQSAWGQLTDRPLPGQTDASAVAAMQQNGAKPVAGTMVSVTTPDTASGFKHRDELVYLPPAWYATNPPPRLPVALMIGGVIGRPGDWLRAGGAQKTLDDFAAAHGGNAPVVVFVDALGDFRNDTECVNGPRGNAADHLTKDVVPYIISKFGVSADPANWGIVGWSMGGTCAVTLTMKYPELFNTFVDIDGDLYPNAGDPEQTIDRLFDGDEQAFQSFEPTTVIPAHGPYTGIAGWFSIAQDIPTVYRPPAADPGSAAPPGLLPNVKDYAASANYLCELASDYGVECSVVAEPTKHNWPGAEKVFGDALPWLAGRIGVPGAPQIPLPGAPTVP
jgi:S-formylglutathione hydrolase FrmB